MANSQLIQELMVQIYQLEDESSDVLQEIQ